MSNPSYSPLFDQRNYHKEWKLLCVYYAVFYIFRSLPYKSVPKNYNRNWEQFITVLRLQEIGFSLFCDRIYHIVKYLCTNLVTAETCCFVHTTTDTLTNATKICHLSDGCENTCKGVQPRLRNSFIIIRKSFVQFHIVKLAPFLTENFETFGFIRRRIACCTQQNSKPDVLWHEFGLIQNLTSGENKNEVKHHDFESWICLRRHILPFILR